MYQQWKQSTFPCPYVFSGPSGSGKSTLLKLLQEEFPGRFAFSVSHTTREPRAGEVNSIDYHFVSNSEMKILIEEGKFLEYAQFAGNWYGTSTEAVQSVIQSGKICLLDVERVGVLNLKNCAENALGCQPHYIFIQPPDLNILEQRLRTRGTESEDKLKARLLRAKEDVDFGHEAGVFDIVIVNDDLQRAYTQLKEFMWSDLKEHK